MKLQPADVEELADLLARLLRHPDCPRLPVTPTCIGALRTAARELDADDFTAAAGILTGWADQAWVVPEAGPLAMWEGDTARLLERMRPTGKARVQRNHPWTSWDAASLTDLTIKKDCERVATLLWENPDGLAADEVSALLMPRFGRDMTSSQVNSRFQNLRERGWAIATERIAVTRRQGRGQRHILTVAFRQFLNEAWL